jgi:hypothetical protein
MEVNVSHLGADPDSDCIRDPTGLLMEGVSPLERRLLSTTVERFAFGEAQERRERSVRRRQPVRFLGLARRFFSTATTFP